MKKALFGLTVLFAATAYANWLGALSEPSSATIDGASFYEISSPEELAWFAAQVNAGHSDINAVLKKDIVFFEDSLSEENIIGAYPWTPIAYSSENAFSGIFDGADHKIVGVHLEDYDYSYAADNHLGFFGIVGSQGVIKNLRLEQHFLDVNYQQGTSPYGKDKVAFGSLAGKNEGLIQNVTVGGSARFEIPTIEDESAAMSYGSGIVGENTGSLLNVLFTGTIISKSPTTGIGGIAGINRGLIDSAKNKGTFVLDDANNQYTGGIVYSNTLKIMNSENYADIISKSLLTSGGIAAVASDSLSVISHSRNYGNIQTKTYHENNYGGIAGAARGIVEYCENYGNLNVLLTAASACAMGCSSSGGKVGGIVGAAYTSRYGTRPTNKQGKIDRNVNYGKITAKSNVTNSVYAVPVKAGGVVGYSGTDLVTNNRNFGDMVLTGTMGELGTIVALVDSANRTSSVVAGNYSICDTTVSLSGLIDKSGAIAYVNGTQKVYKNYAFRKNGDEEKIAAENLAYQLNKWSNDYTNSKAWSRGVSQPILADANNQPSFQVRFYDASSWLLKTVYTDSTGIVKDAPVPPEKQDSVFLGWRYSKKTNQDSLKMVNLNIAIDKDYDLYPFYGDDSIERKLYTFYNDDGSLMWSNITRDDGSIPYPAKVTKNATAQYTYTFDGWLKLSEFEYQATFDSLIRSYEIKFYQGRKRLHSTDSLIYSVTLEYGQMPEFKGVEPTYDSLNTSGKLSNYVYSFSGRWTPALTPVTGAATYRAIMDSVYRKYEITFFDYDSVTVLQQAKWEYNSIPQYEGEVPVRAPAGNKIYEFSGWIPEPVKVTKATSYYAKYDSVKVVPGSSSSAVESSSSAVVSSSSEAKSSSSAVVSSSSEARSSSSAVASSSSEAKSSSSAVVSSSSEAKSSSSVVVSSSSEIESSSGEGTTDIKVRQNPQFSLQTIGRNLQISGANPGFPFAIMDLQGSVVLRGITTANFEVTLPRSGSYLVRIENNIARVNIR